MLPAQVPRHVWMSWILQTWPCLFWADHGKCSSAGCSPECCSLIPLSETWAELSDQWCRFLTWWRGVELSPTLAAGWWQLFQPVPVAYGKKEGQLRLWQAWSSFSIAPMWLWPASHGKHEMCVLKHRLCWAWPFYLGLLWSGGLWAPSPALVCRWAWWEKVHMVQGEGEDPGPMVELGFLLHAPSHPDRVLQHS